MNTDEISVGHEAFERKAAAIFQALNAQTDYLMNFAREAGAQPISVTAEKLSQIKPQKNIR